jgi:hypothetical protein
MYAATGESRLYAYRLVSDLDPCVVRDLSTAGAGLELSGLLPSVGDQLALHLRLGERARASIELPGEVRHARVGDHGLIYAGIEFVALGNLERALLLRLLQNLRFEARQTG